MGNSKLSRDIIYGAPDQIWGFYFFFLVAPCDMWASLVVQMVKDLPTMQETWVWSLGSKRSTGEGNGNPLQYSCLENSMDRGAWRATVHRVAKSWIWLMWLSMHAPWVQHLARSSRYYSVLHFFVKTHVGTSLVVQQLRICLAMQGMRVRFLVGELRSHMPNKDPVSQIKESFFTFSPKPSLWGSN